MADVDAMSRIMNVFPPLLNRPTAQTYERLSTLHSFAVLKTGSLVQTRRGDEHYDRDAPTNVGATHTPRAVRILCTLCVAGFTQAASLLSSVVKPAHAHILATASDADREHTGLNGLEDLLLRVHLGERRRS
jgi:hypothetical protein